MKCSSHVLLIAFGIGGLVAATASTRAGDDLEYGQYLASECVTCHRITGEDKGIPSIVGWPKGYFKKIMRDYRAKKRSNPVMQTIAAGLDDTQISALAAYFLSLKEKQLN